MDDIALILTPRGGNVQATTHKALVFEKTVSHLISRILSKNPRLEKKDIEDVAITEVKNAQKEKRLVTYRDLETLETLIYKKALFRLNFYKDKVVETRRSTYSAGFNSLVGN